MSGGRRRGARGVWAALAVAAALAAAGGGCKTVREELKPVRETTLSVARSAGDVTLSWIGVRGTYYTVTYSDERGGRARWLPLPGAINVLARESGTPIVVYDRLPPAQPRYYRLVQDSKPMVP